MTVIKQCVDPMCEQTHHFTPVKEKYCRNCGGRMITINEKTWRSKFRYNPWQWNCKTDKRIELVSETGISVQTELFND